MNNQDLYQKFADIWGQRRPARLSNVTVWDGLAYDWEQSMEHSPRFRENMAERIGDTVDFLKKTNF